MAEVGVSDGAAGSRDALHRVLRDGWGYEEFREGQLEVCEAVAAGKDCAVFWATGRGKSLCYQASPHPPRPFPPGLTPLFSLPTSATAPHAPAPGARGLLGL